VRSFGYEGPFADPLRRPQTLRYAHLCRRRAKPFRRARGVRIDGDYGRVAYHRVEDGPWPYGTTVAVWASSSVSGGVPSGPPIWSSVATEDGTVVFGGLTEGGTYVAFGSGGSQTFIAATGSTIVQSAGQATVAPSAGNFNQLVNALPSLKAFWRFDDTSTTAVDDTGLHAGTYTAPYTQRVASVGFNAAPRGTKFTGGRVQLADTTDLRLGGGSYSIGLLLRVDALPGSGYAFLAKKRAAGPAVLLVADGSIQLTWFDGATKALTTNTGLIQPGGRYLIGVQSDTSTFKVFVNGRQEESASMSDAGIFSVTEWTMFAETDGTVPASVTASAVFACQEAIGPGAWTALWDAAVRGEPAPYKPLGVYRHATGGSASFSNLTQTANRFDIVTLNAWDTATRDALKAANPSLKALVYQNVGAMRAGRHAVDNLSSSVVNYDEAGTLPASTTNALTGAHASWFLTAISTSKAFTFAADAALYAANVGDAGYQARVVNNLRTLLEGSAWDGVFMDDVNPTLKYQYSASDVVQYATDAAYSAATRSMLARVGPAIRGMGKLAFANVGSTSEYPAVSETWIEFLDGLMDEFAVAFASGAGGLLADFRVNSAVKFAMECQRQGRWYLGLSSVADGDEARALYIVAHVLLAQEGRALVGTNEYAAEQWFSAYSQLTLGAPVTVAAQQSNGVWKRVFEGGTVYLNQTTGPLTTDGHVVAANSALIV
jgi:hypothetical protein